MQNTRKIIIAAVVAVVIIIGITIFSYVSSHGTLSVSMDDSNAEYSYYHDSDVATAAQKAKLGSTITVPSGTYTVNFDDGNSHYAKTVEVSGFFKNTATTFTKFAQRHVERLAGQTSAQLALGGDGYLYGIKNTSSTALISSGDFTRFNTTDPSGRGVYDRTVSFQSSTLSANKLVGFNMSFSVKSNIQQLSSTGLLPGTTTPTKVPQLSIYDFATNSLTVANKTYPTTISDVRLVGSSVGNSSSFGLSYAPSKGKATLDVFKGSSFVSSFDITSVADGSASKAVAVNDLFVATGTGTSYVGTGADDPAASTKTTPKDYVINVYSAASKNKVHEVAVGKISPMKIGVSSDGRYVSAINDDSVDVYDATTGTRLLHQKTSFPGSPVWLEDGRLLFSADDQGIFAFDPQEGSSYTIFSGSTLRISQFAVLDKKILFSAYSNQAGFTKNQNPDAYVVDLTREASGDNTIITKLPYMSSTFKAVSVSDKIYIYSLMTPQQPGDVPSAYRGILPNSETFRQDALKYLKANVKDLDKHTVLEIITEPQ